jgi:hypothetical protein
MSMSMSISDAARLARPFGAGEAVREGSSAEEADDGSSKRCCTADFCRGLEMLPKEILIPPVAIGGGLAPG